jgi:hypothetical protein
MQLTKQTSGEDPWLVLTAQLDGTARFLELPISANDAARAARTAASRSRVSWEDGALPPARPADGLLRAIKRAACWLAAETLFGFAVCGSAMHSYPAWSAYTSNPAEPGGSDNPN